MLGKMERIVSWLEVKTFNRHLLQKKKKRSEILFDNEKKRAFWGELFDDGENMKRFF